MKEIRFSNQNMQNYYNEIMNMETSELNLTELGIQYALKTKYSNGALEGTNPWC